MVWVEPPLSALSPLLIGCRLFNGHPQNGRTLLLDAVRRWLAPGSPPLRFTASEPISSYELSVWAEADGCLLARQDELVLRSIGAEFTMADLGRVVSTEWDRSLPVSLQQRIGATTGVSHSQIAVGGYKKAPWVAAEDQKRALLHKLGLAAGPGRFFPAGDEHHVETILFLAGVLNRRDVTRVLIADPYLDKAAVNALLVRVREVPEIVLLSSHDRPDLKQPERWWKGSPGSTLHHWIVTIADWCLKRTPSPQEEEPIAALVNACNRYSDALPAKMCVVNVSHTDGKGRQFHDRNVVVELRSGAREVWSLTNSLSMVARRYPLLVTLVDPNVGREVADHLSQLQTGQVPGKPELQSDVLWEKPVPQANRLPSPIPTTTFEASPRILAIMVPDELPTNQLNEAITKGLLEPDINSQSTTWKVPDAMRAQVATMCVTAVQSAGDGAARLLCALGEWEYHGGLSESEYTFDATVVPHAEAALRSILHSAPMSVVSDPLAVSRPAQFPECLDDVRHYINMNAPMDLEPRGLPGLQFAAGILWRHAPDLLIAVAEEVGGSYITGWLASVASNLSAAQGHALLRATNPQIVAVGVTLLWDRTLHFLALPGARTTAIDTAMVAANVPQFDRFLAELLLTVPGAGSVAELNQSLTACLAQAPRQLDAPSLERLVGILSTNGPLHSIVRASALAHLMPTPSVANQIHQWCIDKVTQHLHFRNSPVPARTTKSPPWDSVSVREAFARSYWHVHGTQTPARYIGDILARLNFRTVDAPLYPTREYGKWTEQVTGLLWGMTLGIAVVNAASAADHPTAIQAVLPELIRCLQEFRPGLWHRYGDFQGLLAALVETLSAWIDDPATLPADRTAWDNMLIRPIMPELWKIHGTLGSTYLTQNHMPDLPYWTQNPASSPSLCERPRNGPTRTYLAASIEARKVALPNLATDLDTARDSLMAWWNARYPAE